MGTPNIRERLGRLIYMSADSTMKLRDNVGFAVGAAAAGVPTAGSDERGVLRRVESATGIGDILVAGGKMANGSYTYGRLPVDGIDLIVALNDANFTMGNVNTVQSFLEAAKDTITVEASTWYDFEAFVAVTHGGTTHTTAFTLKGAGTATITSILYFAVGQNVALGTTGTTQDSVPVATDDGTGVVINATSTASTTSWIRGRIKINAAGTLIPSLKFSADPTGTVLALAGSGVILRRLSSAAIGPVA